MRVVVLGGGGAMGRVCVMDLVASGVDEVVVADRNERAAGEVAGASGARPVAVEVTDHERLVELLEPADVVCNCVNYRLNVPVMRAAAAAKTHYLDLGGLYHGTLEQLRLAADVEASGTLALLGVGSTPGTTNVMAAMGAERLDRVDEVHIRCGGWDRKPSDAVLPAPFALDTILDEFSLPAMAVRQGRLVEVDPATTEEPFDFPEPVGRQVVVAAVHSELATFPRAFPDAREISFKLAYGDEMTRRYRFVTELGLSGTDPIDLPDGTRVVPREVLKALALGEPQRFSGEDVETLVVEMRGERDGARWEVRVEETCPPAEDYGVGGADANTGIPPSVVAQMVARGDIEATGVKAPEEAVPPREYFAELAKRGVEVHIEERPRDEQEAR
jgi:lysine 6-dehydrogenase